MRKWREAVEDCTVRSFVTCTLHKMRRAGMQHRREVKKRVLCFGWKSWREETA